MLGGCGLTFAGRVNGENGNSTGLILMVNFIQGGHLVTFENVMEPLDLLISDIFLHHRHGSFLTFCSLL